MTDLSAGDGAAAEGGPIQVPVEWFRSGLYRKKDEFEAEVATLGLTPLLDVLKNLGRLYSNYQQEYTPYGMHRTATEFSKICRAHNLVCPLVQHCPPERHDGAIFADACKMQ